MYRNVLQTPQVSIQVGAREIYARYAARHRRLATWLIPRVLGLSVDGSQADLRAIGRRLPFVRFVPLT